MAYTNKNLYFSMQKHYLHYKSNHFIVTSPQHKCLGEWNSYERAPDSAKKQQTIYLWTDSAKKQQTIYLWTDSAKKQQTIYIWTDSAKKTALEHLQCSRQCKKTTTAIYIWTDSAKKTTAIYIWTDIIKKCINIIVAPIWTKLHMFSHSHFSVCF